MVTIAAAAILLQRFYGKRSFVHNDKLVSPIVVVAVAQGGYEHLVEVLSAPRS